MAITLAEGIGPTDSILSLSAPCALPSGATFRLEDEVLQLTGHPHRRIPNDHHLISVKRGVCATDAVSHTVGTSVIAISDAYVSAEDEVPPSPIVGNGGGGEHPNLAAHETLGLVTDTDLTTHAATAHGTQDHAIGGASHTGSLAQSSVTNLTTDLAGKASSSHNHDGTYATAGHAHPGGSEAFPVGAVFIAVVSTDPATLLGYGTWSAFGAGRVLVGRDSGDTDFDTAEETGGAKTKAISAHAGAAVADHSVTQPNAHTDVPTHTHTTDSQGAHVHDEFRNSATTGGLDGWAAGDTSTNTPTLTGYDTGSAGGHTHTAQTPAGAVASQPHAGTAVSAHSVTQPSAHSDLNVVQPYIVVYMWKRTA